MAMGTRKQREKQEGLWIAHTELTTNSRAIAAVLFLLRLVSAVTTNEVLAGADGCVSKAYVEDVPVRTPGVAREVS